MSAAPPGAAPEGARGARRQRWRALAPPVIVIGLALAAAVVPGWLAPSNPLATNFAMRLQPLGTVAGGHVYWLGTDGLGRDVLSRLIYGTRISILTALAAVLGAGVIGGAMGLTAGFFRRGLGAAIMRLADTMMAIPFLLLAILIITELGSSLPTTIVALIVTTWPVYARTAYATTLKTIQAEFVDAARAAGSTTARLLFRHVLPFITSSLLVIGTLQVATMILYEAGLSFLGLGAQPPTPSWGSMLADGEGYVATAWWLITFPGLALFALVWAVNQGGDYLQTVLNPRLRD